MSYAVDFTHKAQQKFDELPPAVGAQILDRLELLARDPTNLSHAGGTAFRGSQVHRFWGTGEAERWWITIAFRYSQDERTLLITGIRIRKY
jgi:hypothetical protein